MQPAGLHAWYFRSCIAKRRLVCNAMRLRGAWHSSLNGIACMGIDLPAWLFAAWGLDLLTGPLFAWTKLQTNQPLTT